MPWLRADAGPGGCLCTVASRFGAAGASVAVVYGFAPSPRSFGKPPLCSGAHARCEVVLLMYFSI